MATPAVGGSPASGAQRGPVRGTGRQGTEEFHSTTLPAAHESAILYSANNPEAATSLLKAEIKDAMGRNNKQAWLMLFDLHQLASSRADFDALSMLFTVKFEQSPPAWTEQGESATDPRRTQSRERKDFFAFKGASDGELVAEIEKFVTFAEAQGSVRLDVGKVSTLSPEEATLLVSALHKLRKKNMPMWFNNLEGFEKLLRAAANERTPDEGRPFWLLLFELLIVQGKAEEFEELGLEFAVAFEMSPPNWEVYLNSIAAAVAKATGAHAAKPEIVATRPEAGFAMKGVLSAASSNQIAELNGYAATRSEVVVDMSKVLRIDFIYTSAFFDVVKAIQLAGKRVILTNINELNAALLEALGVNRYAILVRRKSN